MTVIRQKNPATGTWDPILVGVAGPPGPTGPSGGPVPPGGTTGDQIVKVGAGVAWQSAPMVDIRTYGALSNGSDCTSAIQAAITAVAGGGTVFIPGGTWKMNGKVTGTGSRVQLQLAPDAIIDATALPLNSDLFYFEGAIASTTTCTANVTRYTRNLPVASSAGFAVGDKIRMLSTQPWDLTRGVGEYCYSEWNRVFAIPNGTSLRLEKMVAYNWDNTTYPVTVQRMAAVDGITVRGGTFNLGGADKLHTAIRVLYGTNVRVQDVTVNNSENTGIALQRCWQGIVTGCTVMHTDDDVNGYGIFCQGSEDVIISNNLGSYNRRSFEATGGENGISRNVLITNNIARNDRTTGVGTHAGTDHVVMSHNIVEACGGGIISRGANATISNNTIVNCIDTSTGDPDAGVGYLDGIIIGADVPGVPQAVLGQNVGGIAPKVIDNRVFGSNRYSLNIRGGDMVDAEVSRNHFEGRASVGLSDNAYTATRFRFHDNDVVGQVSTGARDTYGVFFRHKQMDVSIKRNRVRYASAACIRVTGSPTDATPNIGLVVADNEVSDSLSYGFDIATGRWQQFVAYNNVATNCVTPFRNNFASDGTHVRPVVFNNHANTADAAQGPVNSRTVAPTAGTWRVGDYIWNQTPTTTSPFAWVCTTAGTPGTWTPVTSADGAWTRWTGNQAAYDAIVTKDPNTLYVVV